MHNSFMLTWRAKRLLYQWYDERHREERAFLKGSRHFFYQSQIKTASHFELHWYTRDSDDSQCYSILYSTDYTCWKEPVAHLEINAGLMSDAGCRCLAFALALWWWHDEQTLLLLCVMVPASPIDSAFQHAFPNTSCGSFREVEGAALTLADLNNQRHRGQSGTRVFQTLRVCWSESRWIGRDGGYLRVCMGDCGGWAILLREVALQCVYTAYLPVNLRRPGSAQTAYGGWPVRPRWHRPDAHAWVHIHTLPHPSLSGHMPSCTEVYKYAINNSHTCHTLTWRVKNIALNQNTKTGNVANECEIMKTPMLMAKWLLWGEDSDTTYRSYLTTVCEQQRTPFTLLVSNWHTWGT